MFKNQIILVNKNFLSNKDRKNLAINIKKSFHIENEAQIDEILNKEDISISKIQNMKIFVYMSKNIPILFSINNTIIPSIYTLWKYPLLLPSFVIYPSASEFLLRGADLMIPGICKDIENVEKLKIGNIWSVRVFNNPYIFCLGECLIDKCNNSSDFFRLKGKCLKILHIFNDELWKLGPKIIPDKSFRSNIIDSVEEIIDDFKFLKINENNVKNVTYNNKNNKTIINENNKKIFGWNDGVDECKEIKDEKEKVKEINKILKESEKKKLKTNEIYLENFHKHLYNFKEKIKNNNKNLNNINEENKKIEINEKREENNYDNEKGEENNIKLEENNKTTFNNNVKNEKELCNEINENNKVLDLDTNQQDILLLYTLLEVLYYINDDQLPLEFSGVYSRMNKECNYMHLNEILLKELEKCNISNENIIKIKNKEINLSLDIKKSSYKKLSKFIQHCVKIKLIKVKENRNIISLVNINKHNNLIKTYKPVDLQEKKNINHNKDNIINLDVKENNTIQILEYYMITDKTYTILKSVNENIQKRSYLTLNELKNYFKTYIKSENLINENNKNLIKLNDNLKKLLTSQQNEQNDILYDELLKKFISLNNPYYAIINSNENINEQIDLNSIKLQKGTCPFIYIYAVSRMGNKKWITHISNLFLFLTDLNKVSEHLQKHLACSCSTTISPSTNKKEILVQGNVVNQVENVLINYYKIPKKYIILNTKA